MPTQVTAWDEDGIPMKEVPLDPNQHAHLFGGTVKGWLKLSFFIRRGLAAVVQHPITGEDRLVAVL